MKKTTKAAMKNSRRALRAIPGATAKTNGAVLWSGPSPHDGKPIVAIATGIARPSRNGKTGNMVQVFIMRSDVDPLTALRAGMSGSVCGGCALIGILRPPTPKERRREARRLRKLAKAAGRTELLKLAERACYVAVHQSVMAVFRAFVRGKYPTATPEQARNMFAGRALRLGAYGDPAFLPLDLLRTLTRNVSTWTGYTHAWRERPEYLELLMGSADTQADAREIDLLGGRSFSGMKENEIIGTKSMQCPATTSKKLSCERCGRCNGRRGTKERGTARNVHLVWHGAGAGNVR